MKLSDFTRFSIVKNLNTWYITGRVVNTEKDELIVAECRFEDIATIICEKLNLIVK